MPMPLASMMWMRMPGQTWPGAAAAFVGMWTVMMVPMMLPTVAPVLLRHRRAMASAGARCPASATIMVGGGYFFVWCALGPAVFPVGSLLSALVIRQSSLARAVPLAIGMIVVMVGAIQLTPWKARRLACCRSVSCCEAPRTGAAGAWRDGVRLGLHCVACCANLMIIPLVVGAMDVRAMAVIGGAIAAERLSTNHEIIARAVGVMLLASGCFLMARAIVR